MTDLHYALRQLWKNPGFAGFAVLTIALGVGANTALFSVINSILLRPLPYPEPDRIVAVCESNSKLGWERYATSLGAYVDWREQISAFQELAGAMVLGPTPLVGQTGSEMIHAASVSANFFPLLGIQPLLGRQFLPAEEAPDAGNVVLLSEGLWRSRFAADPSVLNQPVVLGDRTFTVVGVMPATLKLFDPVGVQGWDSGFAGSDVWRPLPVKSGLAKQRNYRAFLVLGRLKPGVTRAQAQVQMTRLAREQARLHPESNEGWGIAVHRFDELVVGQARRPLLLLFAAVAVVLLIATANLANLSLARAALRQREVAVRMALGASPLRIARQFLVESLALAGLGGATGLLVAHGSLRLFAGLIPAGIPRTEEIRLDAWALGFALLASMLVGVLFGLAPVLGLFRQDPNHGLKQDTPGSTGGRHRHRLRAGLIVAQVALATILLSGSGSLLCSFWRLNAVDPGFRPSRVVAADVALNGRAYDNGLARINATQGLLARLGALTGEATFAAVDGLPLDAGRANMDISVQIEGTVAAANPDGGPTAGLRLVSPGYFSLMGIPLSQGRFFNEQDTTNAPEVAIINESFAKKYFHGINPLGKRISSPDFGPKPCVIVGIVGNVRHSRLDALPQPEVSRPLLQQCFSGITVVARSQDTPARTVETVRSAMATIDRRCPVYNARPMDRLVSTSLESRRLALWFMQAFAGVSLLLAMVGIHGVLSCAVGERTREIGIRLALGARRGQVLAMVVKHGMQSVALGGALGLAGACGLGRVLRSLLYEVSPTDPATLAAVGVFVGSTALLACWLPARRAAQVDAMMALRNE